MPHEKLTEKTKTNYQGFRRVCQKHLDIHTDQNNVKTNTP
jgi:hypothetical protein